tara:strand:+ start:4745 stop:6424 length:1680 start_codon:yes stop_codon:yes gene_type:complete
MDTTTSYVEDIDILTPSPLARAVDVEVETNILEPVSHQYTSRNGGTTRFVLPAKAVLDAPNAAITFEIVNGEATGEGTDRRLAFPLMSGATACIRRITCRTGGQIISQVNEVDLYNTVKNIFKSNAYKRNILDVRHGSSNSQKLKILQNQSGSTAITGYDLGAGLVGYHQISNDDIDTQNTWGKNVLTAAAPALPNANVGVSHLFQKNKLLRNFDNRGLGPEVTIRLGDVMPFFESNQLPLLAMAQTEIVIEWNSGPAATARYDSLNKSPVIVNNTALAGTTAGLNIGFAAPPTLQVDYIHYPEEEQMKIMNAVQGPGLRLNFSEVVTTYGVNPEKPAGDGTTAVTSNHILGMAGKEVKKIYISKNYDKLSTQGQAERNNTQSGCQTHVNKFLWDLKSIQTPGEVYNFIVNNERMYGIDISNPSQAYNQLKQCEEIAHVLPAQFDSMDFNQNVLNLLNNTKEAGTVDNAAADTGFTQRMLGASMNVIGLNLDKYNEMGNAVGNGERIGSAPIEVRFTCNKTRDAGTPANENSAAVNLTFFIEHRRSLIINKMGATVSDQ